MPCMQLCLHARRLCIPTLCVCQPHAHMAAGRGVCCTMWETRLVVLVGAARTGSIEGLRLLLAAGILPLPDHVAKIATELATHSQGRHKVSHGTCYVHTSATHLVVQRIHLVALVQTLDCAFALVGPAYSHMAQTVGQPIAAPPAKGTA
jgi:hypothetical protein